MKNISVEFNWPNIWGVVLVLAVVSALTLIGIAICQPHNVDYYYLGHDDSGRGTCVNAHWTWTLDARVYCTDDAKFALQMMIVANASLNSIHRYGVQIEPGTKLYNPLNESSGATGRFDFIAPQAPKPN